MDNKKSINEQVDKILYYSRYNINESPRYKELLDGVDDDDQIPDSVLPEVTPISANDSNVYEDDENIEKPQSDELSIDDEETSVDVAPEIGETPPEEIISDQPEEVRDTDDIQNDIIKLNISAMEKLRTKLNNLDSTVDVLNSKFDSLNKEVEEVKEPTNIEKLMNRKEDSHPFYYNLNDMWDDNYFQARRDQFGENGIVQLEDGTYVADFDNLPPMTSKEIKDTF